MRKKITSVVAVFMALFVFVGCGKKTLEQKVSKDELKAMNDSAYNMYVKNSTTYKDVKIEIEKNNITYKLYYAMDLTDDQKAEVKSSIESSGLKESIADLKDQFEKDVGIRPDKVTYIYYGNDDEEIVTIAD